MPDKANGKKEKDRGAIMRRVVVTGMGAVTPIGIGVEAFWENVKKKTLGFGEIPGLIRQIIKYTLLRK